MQKPLEIICRGMDHSDALDTHIREKAAKLEEFYPRMISCRVTVEQPHRHHHQGNRFDVKIDVHLPGKAEVLVNRQNAEDVYVALRDAFDAAKRKLEDYGRVQRGDVKAHAEPLHGHVARIFADEGYGFIQASDGRELYFSRDNVVSPDFDQLAEGVEVQFIEEMAQEGPQAKRISVGKHHFE